MTESFVTQCPHCRTRFRVNLAQLGAARGAVRCGACLHVFNAARQLLEQGQQLPVTVSPPPAPAPAPQAPPEASRPGPAEAPEQAPPALKAPPAAAQTSSDTLWIHDDLDLDSLDLDEELAKLEEQEQQLSQQFLALERPLKPSETFHPPPCSGQQAHDEQWAEALLHEDSPKAPLSLAPLPDCEQPVSSTPTGATPDRAPRPAAHATETETDDDDTPAAEALPLTAQRDEAPIDLSAALDEFDEPTPPPIARASRSEPGLREEHLFELDDEPLQLDWQRPRKPWGRLIGWSLLSLLAAGALAGQYVTYHFDQLARQDDYRPWFERLCPTLGCSLPSKVDIAQIKSSNLVVRSHPDFSGALVVDAILYNRASFAQPFPLLEIRFADINGQLLASRRFKPSEYLGGELAGQAEMPPQTPIHVSLDILDPGTQAVNYSLSFHSPE